MNQSSLEILEYAALKALLGRFVSTSLGQSELDRVSPSTDRDALELTLAETSEAMEYNQSAVSPASTSGRGAARLVFQDLPDAAQALARISIEGASLDAREILDIIQWLERASESRMYLLSAAQRFPRLGKKAGQIGEFRGILRDLAGKILPDGSVADHASVALERIRRGMSRQQTLIQESLEKFMRAHRDEGVLQEEFVTIRNDRYVVPLVAGQRRKVDGVIHAASSSGQTLFVEPMATIELNNELVRLSEEEMREVHRILREMTAQLREHSTEIRSTFTVMAELELLFAKARFASDFRCVIPTFGSKLSIQKARHPLLEDVLRRQKKQVVPVTLTLSGVNRTLLISGPNTGGKTVTLKTVGLLTLMAQSGMPVPCDAAEFPLFHDVLADVGDNQSIEQSLSSFSSHILQVREMIDAVSPDCLVLMDELGRATDPEEGGALGLAVLDHFRRQGCFTLASTHLLALKVYGGNTEGVVNASMGFNEETLQPTYVLRVGAPGKSAGLDIAGRLGIPAFLIERARAAMSSSEREISRFLHDLDIKLAEVSELEQQLSRQRIEQSQAFELQRKELAKREEQKLKEIERRSSLLLEKFEQEARAGVDQMMQGQGQRKAAEQALKKIVVVKRDFERELAATVRETKLESGAGELTQLDIREGVRVKIRDMREPVKVLKVKANGEIEVQAGFMKMKVERADVLEVLPDAKGGAKLPKNVTFSQGPTWTTITTEINVIGQRAEEALEAVDKFIDSAAMAEVQRVRVVHGHGMGILRKLIQEALGKNPHVSKFFAATPAEGGTGATIAELEGR